MEVHPKKTDAHSPDDEVVNEGGASKKQQQQQRGKSKSDLEKPIVEDREEEQIEEEEEEIEEEVIEEVIEDVVEQAADGQEEETVKSAPRKRKPRKD